MPRLDHQDTLPCLVMSYFMTQCWLHASSRARTSLGQSPAQNETSIVQQGRQAAHRVNGELQGYMENRILHTHTYTPANMSKPCMKNRPTSMLHNLVAVKPFFYFRFSKSHDLFFLQTTSQILTFPLSNGPQHKR